MHERLNQLIKKSKSLSVEALQKEVAQIMSSYPGYGKRTWNTFEPYGIYRARQHNHTEGNLYNEAFKPFVSESEFWNTPEEYCKLGRCNNDGESIFYCTNEFEVAIQEIKPDQEYISVSTYKPKPKHLQASFKTAISIGNAYLAGLPSLKKFSIDKFDKTFSELDAFLDNLFHLDITEGKEYLYKLSTAVTKNLMSSIRTKLFDIPMQGLIYPSMARDKKGYNIAFRPEHVISNYYLYSIQTFKVIENTNDYLTIQLLRNGEPMGIRDSRETMYNIFWYEPITEVVIHRFEKKPSILNISLNPPKK